MLLTDRRRAFGRREEDDEREAWQGSLFAPDALGPPARPPGPTPDPFAPPHGPAEPEAAAGQAGPQPVPAPAPTPAAEAGSPVREELTTEARAALPEVAVPDHVVTPAYDDDTADYVDEDPADSEPAYARVPAPRSVLAGPTLDDVMSRAWEGLRAEVPTPCPVCHAEIEPSAHGRCGACGSTLA